MKWQYFIFLILFLSFTYCLNITPTLNLVTTAPDSPPYFLGTEINTIRLSFVDDNSNPIFPADKLGVKIGDKKLELLKVGQEYIANPDLMITSNIIKGLKLIVELDPVVGYTLYKKSFEFELEPLSDYIDISKPEIKENYNYGQKIDFEYTITPFKKDLKNLKMWIFKPSLEDNAFNCIDFVCKKNLTIPNIDSNNLDLVIYGVFTYHGRNIPFVDIYNIKLTDNLSIELVNPDRNGYLYNPFVMEFKVRFENGELFNGDVASFSFDGSEKILKKKDTYYFVNYFMFPFLSFDHNLVFSSGKSKVELNANFYLKPTLWFYLLVCFFGFVFLIEFVIHIFKKFKKLDLNELIAKRDLYKEKQKNLRKEYLSRLITKTYFDSENEKLEYTLSYLTKLILDLEKKQSSISALESSSSEKKRKIVMEDIKVEEPKEKTKKDSIFKRIFKKKPKEDKFEYKPPKEEEIKEGKVSVDSWYK